MTAPSLDASAEHQLDAIATAIERHATDLGQRTAVPGQILSLRDDAVGRLDMQYVPMVCFVARGAKHALCGQRRMTVGRGQLFMGLLEAPVTAMLETPYRSATLVLDEARLARLAAELDDRVPSEPGPDDVFTTNRLDPALADAVLRWIALLDEPQHIPALASRVEDEMLYRLFVGPTGGLLRSRLLAGGRVPSVRAAASYLVDRITEPFSLARTAAAANVSQGTLLRHFKQIAGTSPLQFHKQLRMQQARQLMLLGDHTAASAGAAVGYVSPSQFNRDYRRFYGVPPLRHTQSTTSHAIDAAPRVKGSPGRSGRESSVA